LELASFLNKLKQAYNFLIPFFFGLLGVLAFAPFSIKFLIIPAYSYLIHLVFFSDQKKFITKLSLWTLGHWGIGVSWIIVSVYYYGNVGYIASFIVYILFLILILIFAVAPIRLFKIQETYKASLCSIVFISSALLLIELTRDFFFGGFPWLIPGTVSVDTLISNLLPIFGIAGASFLIYLGAAAAASFWNSSKKIAISILVFTALFFIPFNTKNVMNNDRSISIAIVQPSLDPKLKLKQIYKPLIQETLIKLSLTDSIKSELIIWPEAELPFVYKSREYYALKKRFSESTELITGMWLFEGSELFNSLVNVKTDQIYKKQHLVPFGEYIPFKTLLNPILIYFGAPISDISPGKPDQLSIQVKDSLNAAPLICYDIVFGNDVRKAVKSSDFIINISNDSWFGRSLGPYQHLEISRIRAIENNKWLLRSTNDGFSAVIDNKGTIVDILLKGEQGVLNQEIGINNSSTIYANFGYYVPYLSALVILFSILFRKKWLKLEI
jgi:apolipoprotein N-acyltransferase